MSLNFPQPPTLSFGDMGEALGGWLCLTQPQMGESVPLKEKQDDVRAECDRTEPISPNSKGIFIGNIHWHIACRLEEPIASPYQNDGIQL